MTLRLKPLPHLEEVPPAPERASSEPAGFDLPAPHDFAQRSAGMAEVVSRAAKTINDLLERNAAIRAEAEAAIVSASNDVQEQRRRSKKIQDQIDTIREERQKLVLEGERRIRALTEETAALKSHLEKASAELAHSEQWLEYLNTRIKTQLEDVFAKAEALRGGRRSDPSA